jgi:hypothetical protein
MLIPLFPSSHHLQNTSGSFANQSAVSHRLIYLHSQNFKLIKDELTSQGHSSPFFCPLFGQKERHPLALPNKPHPQDSHQTWGISIHFLSLYIGNAFGLTSFEKQL